MKRILSIILMTYTVSIFGMAQQADTITWNILMSGKKVGFRKQWKNSDGSITEWFQYNDRGRGDSLVTRIVMDEKGFIISLEGRGHDYMKKSVYEKFSRENGIARWENNAEKGEAKVNGNRMYSTLKVTSGTSYKAFRNSDNATVKVLPSGEEKLRELKKINLQNKRTVTLIETSGLGLIPNYIWIDDNDNLFATVNNWFSTIKEGYEEDISLLLDVQNEFKTSYFKDLSFKLTNTVKKGIVIQNATLFDPIKKTTSSNITIVVENGMIKEVSSGKKVKLPADFTVIDAAGKFVMPGLWDMHVHFGDGPSGIMHVAAGVTNVRDMGNSLKLLEIKRAIENGTYIGPRIQGMSGFIDGAGPFAGPTGEKINNVEEGLKAIKRYADLGYTQIKLYSSIKPEWVKPLADEAHKYNMRVSGHIPAHMLATEAVEAGYNEIQHVNMLFLNFYGKELDTRTPARFTTVAQKAAFFDFNDKEFLDFVKLLKEKQVTIDPTVSTFESMFTAKAGQAQSTMAPVIDRLPLEMQRSIKGGSGLSGGLSVPNGLEETYQKSANNLLKMVKVLYDNGITLVAGTDDYPGFVLHTELENYVKAGIPNAEVLAIATIQSARVADKEKMFGSIEKDKTADIIIIDGNPLKDMKNIRRVETIIKDNTIFNSKELYNSISIKL